MSNPIQQLCRLFVKLSASALLLIGSGQALRADSCAALLPANTPGFEDMLQTFLDNGCHKSWTHDPRIRSTSGVHSDQVRVYFSPTMWNWMEAGRTGEVPDGAMVVKEQYNPAKPGEVSDWAVMVRDSAGAWDGWYWADLVPVAVKDSLVTTAPVDCDPAVPPASGFGQYCLNCHASAINGQNTFATDEYVKGNIMHTPAPLKGTPASPPTDNLHYRLSHLRRIKSASPSASCMVPESSDHVVADGRQTVSHRFVTSDQCTGCHNATGTLTPSRPDLPSMLFYKNKPGDPPHTVNLSPNGEWRNSLMGLAGRDPIFFAQLNSESTIHDNLADHPGQGKEFVQDLCLSCHGVTGERQYHADHNNDGSFYTLDQMKDPQSIYGALGREGISCEACHRMSPNGLGTPDTYTGRFKVNDGAQLYGPFDQPVKLPMQNSLNVEPVLGPHMTKSDMCGSCHTIILPVYRANGQPVPDPTTGKQKVFTEQATFFEWKNSDFRDGGPTPRSCQDCHMPNTFGSTDTLQYKIANIEDKTFPADQYRAPDDQLNLQARDDYHRHTLLGINVFALEMFKQFRNELGLYLDDPMLRPSLNTDNGLDTAIDFSANTIAAKNTASIRVDFIGRLTGRIRADVTVTNKAGHSFPSGVGFRRAFITVEVVNDQGERLWCSGCVADPASSDLKGLIVDGATGKPLVTELFTPTQQAFQPHFWFAPNTGVLGGKSIRRQDQVQIYEELVTNPEGLLNTSFIAMNQKVKDNRLQPKGWSPMGFQADDTKPVGTCDGSADGPACDPKYMDGSGSSTVDYIMESPAFQNQHLRLHVVLNYQTIPPYYQLERASDATGIDTDRLSRFAKTLSVSNTAIQNWALPVATEDVDAPFNNEPVQVEPQTATVAFSRHSPKIQLRRP